MGDELGSWFRSPQGQSFLILLLLAFILGVTLAFALSQ